MDPMKILDKIDKVIDLKIDLKDRDIPLWGRENKFAELDQLMIEIRSECVEYKKQLKIAVDIINRYPNTLGDLSK